MANKWCDVSVGGSKRVGCVHEIGEKGNAVLEKCVGHVHDAGRKLSDGDPRILLHFAYGVQEAVLRYASVRVDGFQMGKITSQLVVTGSEKPGKTKKLQPGDRKWVTLIQGVGATGRVAEMSHLRNATETLVKCKTRKRRYVQVEETLAVGGVADLVAAKESGSHEDGETPTKRVRVERHCGRCGETGHNSRTYNVKIEDIEDSNASE